MRLSRKLQSRTSKVKTKLDRIGPCLSLRSRAAAGTYQVQSVPTAVVDGKFVNYKVATHKAMPRTIDALIAKARTEQPKG